jgi:hypothetical protein
LEGRVGLRTKKKPDWQAFFEESVCPSNQKKTLTGKLFFKESVCPSNQKKP